jgi:hypothetical protein
MAYNTGVYTLPPAMGAPAKVSCNRPPGVKVDKMYGIREMGEVFASRFVAIFMAIAPLSRLTASRVAHTSE